MLFHMATAQSVKDFLLLRTVADRNAVIPMDEFRRECRKWCFEQGYNPPTGRLITRVMREYGYDPTGARYEWYYGGVRWYVEGEKKGVVE
jgi:hypothetical protein